MWYTDSYPDNIYLTEYDDVVEGIFTPAQLFYGGEIAVVVIGAIIGIYVNSTLRKYNFLKTTWN